MGAVLKYTGARLGLFVVAFAIFYYGGVRPLPLAGLFGLLLSGLASFVLLSKQRDSLSVVVTGKIRDFKTRMDAGAAVEDDSDEAHRSTD